MQSFVEHAKCFSVPEGLKGGGRSVATVATEVTLSQERSSFDLIIWGGQSAFVDEESL